MLAKILLLVSVLFVATSEGGWVNLGYGCVSARGEHPKLFTYNGNSGFASALRLTHKSGRIGCAPGRNTNWGCNDQHRTNMWVTDIKRVIMYPSEVLVKGRTGGWYHMPGYFQNSPTLVFDDVGTRYYYKGQQIKVWYGEDLFNYTEGDNHGHTCFDVHIFIVKYE